MRRSTPSETDDDRKDKGSVTALARGLEILRCFGPGDTYLGNAELARRTGIPRPTISRLTATLIQFGCLRYVQHLEKYRLGPGVLDLGYRYLASEGVRELARPYMQELADATDCLVAMGAVEGIMVTYIQVCHGPGPLVLRLGVGSQMPLATSAMGRAYLAVLSEEARRPYLQRLEAHYQQQWPEIRRGLENSFEEYRRFGFCSSDAEWNRDVSGVSVPLVMENGEQVIPFNCGGSSLRLTQSKLEKKLGPRLKELVEQVGQMVRAI